MWQHLLESVLKYGRKKGHGIPEFQFGSKIVPEREPNQQRRRFQVNPLTTRPSKLLFTYASETYPKSIIESGYHSYRWRTCHCKRVLSKDAD